MRLGSFLILLAALCAGCTQQEPAASAAAATASLPGPAAATLPPASAPATAMPATAEPVAAASAQAGPPLLDTLWEWQVSSYTDGSEAVAAAPSSYTLRLLSGGALEVRADCNGAGGSYTLSDAGLELAVGPPTEVACASGSQADVFLGDLADVVSYTLTGSTLSLSLDADAGSMRFGVQAAGAAAAKELRGESTLDRELTSRLDLLLTQGVTPRLPGRLGGASLFPASPGAILLVDTPDGRFWKAAGYARREDRTPMQPDGRFQVGSNTKLFVGVLLLQLEEQGVLALDDPLARWLPDQAARIPNADRMTLRMLANHTSGLADYTAGAQAPQDPSALAGELEKQYSPAELIGQASGRGQPAFAPGEPDRWSYSNTGYILLGLVLEEAAGLPLHELLIQRIFEPLGMSDTRLLQGVPEPGSIVDGYLSFAGANTTRWNASQAWAAGAVASTMPDMLAFAQGLTSGALFDDPATLAKMADFVGSQNMTSAGYQGYGIGLGKFGDGMWGHFGRTPGFETVVIVWPERDITMLGMANASQGSMASWRLLLEQELK